MRNLLLLLCFLFFTTTLSAQHSLTGTVTDSKGEPLPGVQVSLLNTDYDTATDADGFFMFKRLDKQTYNISVVENGFKKMTESISVNGRTSADLEMKSNCWYYWIRFKKCP